jgi:cytochrome c biogenesis factor
VAALLILIGTLYPLFLDALNMGKISVGPPYFNVVFLIPTVPLLALLAVGMHSLWKKGKLGDVKVPLLGMLAASVVLGVLVPVLAYGGFHPMASVGLALGFWVILSSLYEPFDRLRKRQSLSRGVLGMTVAHIGVGLFAIGVTITQSYRIEKDFALQPGESVEMQGYTFRFDSIEHVTGPNWDAEQAHFTVTRGEKAGRQAQPAKARLPRAHDADDGGGHRSRLEPRPVRGDGRGPRRQQVEHAPAVQADGALHLVRVLRDDGRRLHRHHRPALSHAQAGGARIPGCRRRRQGHLRDV